MPQLTTPQREFRPVIKAAILEAGGGRPMLEVLAEVERRMSHQFHAGDLALVTNGEPRWRNAARWERMKMANEGIIKKGTRSGWWELTDLGKRS